MDMNKLDDVEREMHRLQNHIRALRKVHEEEGLRVRAMPLDQQWRWSKTYATSPLHTGAIKRASMDLTRTLARLRSSQ